MLALLGITATAYGVAGALAILLQARQMMARRTSCDVSMRFLAVYTGGYGIWLTYGLLSGSLPLALSDAAGTVCGAFTFAVAVRYHRACKVAQS